MLDTIAVTGASGFVGQELVATLRAAGCNVVPLVRKIGPRSCKNAVEVGDLASARWRDLLARIGPVDVVVHLAARAHRGESEDAVAFEQANVSATRRLADAFVPENTHIVHLSSVAVYGARARDRPLRHDDPPSPTTTYGATKLEAEKALRERLPEERLTIIRAPLVHGPNAPGNLARLRGLVAKGVPLPLPRTNRRHLISRTNLSNAILHVVRRTMGGTFLVADPEPVSSASIVEWMARDMGVNPRLFPLLSAPTANVLRMAGRSTLAEQLFGDLTVDEAENARLGWVPPQRPHEARWAAASDDEHPWPA